MRVFVLSIEDGAIDWFTRLTIINIRTKNELEHEFIERWGEKEDNRYLLTSLDIKKRN
jgi:hypothetical protein